MAIGLPTPAQEIAEYLLAEAEKGRNWGGERAVEDMRP